jgi:two-component system sensor histidine kinase BaeS
MPGPGLFGGPPPPEDFGARLILFDAQGRFLAGPPRSQDFPASAGPSRPIRLGGRTVATVRMIPRGPVPIGVDARFLTTQYEGTALLVVLLLVLGALPAWGIARVATRRISMIHAATDAIARGDLAARIPARGSDELGDMSRNINLMAESLERLDAARRRWLAEVSHELRSPLAAIRGGLDALEDGVRPLSQGAIASLNEDAHRLSRLVDDLHVLAMADLAALPCQFQRFGVIEFCRGVIDQFAPEAAAERIEISLNVGSMPETFVQWDASRIEQLLTNLFSNCLRYTDAPGLALLSLENAGQQIVLSVDDSAPGIPPEHIGHIFEPLYRLDEARSRATGGSGLGLAVCDAIVRAHHGTIAAQPSLLGGLRITVTLPLYARTS